MQLTISSNNMPLFNKVTDPPTPPHPQTPTSLHTNLHAPPISTSFMGSTDIIFNKLATHFYLVVFFAFGVLLLILCIWVDNDFFINNITLRWG